MENKYIKRFTPRINEAGCLTMINNQRMQIANMLNEYCRKTIALHGGEEKTARKYFDEMCGLVDVATMLDILTNEEYNQAYDSIHRFFSGIETSEFSFGELEHHYAEGNTILDCVLIFKINMQEKMNEMLHSYRNFKETELGLDKQGYLRACEAVIRFGKLFAILKEDEQAKAQKIIKQHQNNAIKDKKIIFVPEALYTKVAVE